MSNDLNAAPENAPAHEKGMFLAADGTSLYYEIRGEGKPLVLCYGLTCRMEHWHHQIKAFAKTHQVITFDYRGHHFSSTPSNDNHLTIEWCAKDLHALVAHLGLKEVVCFGHSMGVPVIEQAAYQKPESIRALVMVCGSVHNPFQNMFFTHRSEVLYQVAAKFYDVAPDTTSRVWQKLTRHNKFSFFMTSRFGFNPSTASERDILMYLRGVNETPYPIFHSLLRDYTLFDGREMLRAIKCPTLVVAGDEDWITPFKVQEEMAELLPKGQLEKIPFGSHNAHMDYPELVNDRIYKFLESVDFA